MNSKANPITSQQPNEKNLKSKAFEPVKSLKIDILHLKFRGVGQKIINLIMQRRGKKTSNEYLANKVGCSIGTVKRWTARFERIGLITKEREHLYALNSFNVNLSKQQSFQFWFSSLTTQEQDFYNTNGMTIEKYKSLHFTQQSDTLSYSSSQLVNLLTSSSSNTVIERLSNARATLVYQDPKHFGTISNAAAFSKKVGVMNKEVVVREATKHVQSLSLTKWGQIALSAYPDEAIEYADQVVSNSKTTPKNPFAFFISFCKQYCERKGISPDFGLVLRLENKWGARPDRIFFNPVQKQQQQTNTKQNHAYIPSADAPTIPSINELKSTILKHEQDLALLPLGDRKRADIKAHIFICKQLIAKQQGGMSADFSAEKAHRSALDKFKDQARELRKQIAHFADMIANPSNYFKPNPNMALFINQETWIATTACLMKGKVETLKSLIIDADKAGCDISSVFNDEESDRDNPLSPDVVSPLSNASIEGVDYGEESEERSDATFGDDVHYPLGTSTMEESGYQHLPEDVFRSTEDGQNDIWHRTDPPTWAST